MGRPATDKGRARWDRIVQAAAELLTDGGPPAVTHRAVAARAGVPLGSTTYYFADRDELLAAAIERARATDVSRARAAAEYEAPDEAGGDGAGGHGGDGAGSTLREPAAERRGLARRLVDVVIGHGRLTDPDRVTAHYQRFLGAALTAAGHTSVRDWNREVRDAVAAALARHGRGWASADVVLALVDGCVLAWLVEEAREKGTDALVGRVHDGLGHLGI
ncbi:MAG TPA: TetR family transcriptional regulator [Acidimicrobiales bacterium]